MKEEIVKIDANLVALNEKEHRELMNEAFKTFDHLEKQKIIHALECPTFIMAWSMASLHFDKKIADKLAKLIKDST